MQNNNGVWLNKFISESGICSRREADRYIELGNVFVNGRRAQKGDQVMNGDRVRVNGLELEPRQAEDLVFIALNKPVGIVSTTEKNTVDNIVEFVNHSTRIFPVGRLDKDSQGLIFLTNNGDMVNKILRAGNHHEKEYVVTVDKPLTAAVVEGMANGVPMLGISTKKCKIEQEGVKTFRIILKQGLNRQIRRMCEFYGYEVTKLERVRIMNVTLQGIPPGHWRDLTENEMAEIYRLTEDSSSEIVKPAKSRRSKKETPENEGSFDDSEDDAYRTDRSSKSEGRFSDKKYDRPNPRKSDLSTDRFPKEGAGGRTGRPRNSEGGSGRFSKDGASGRPARSRPSEGSDRFERDGASGRPGRPKTSGTGGGGRFSKDGTSGRPARPRPSEGGDRFERDGATGRPGRPKTSSPSGGGRFSKDGASGRPGRPKTSSTGGDRFERDGASGRPGRPKTSSTGGRFSKDGASGRPGRPKSPTSGGGGRRGGGSGKKGR